MNYRKTFSRIILIALSTIAVMFFMCSIALHIAEAKILFAPRIDYGIDSGSSGAIAIGDLDRDRDLDLAVTGGSGVWVLLGNRDGTFQSAVNYDTGGGPGSVAIGDLNGDSHLDLAVDGGGDLAVLLGNGDGTLQDAVAYGTAGGFEGVCIGDFNGDGALDLVTNKEDDVLHLPYVWVLFGNGDGTFQSAVSCVAGGELGSVAIGDLNRDGDMDLAVPNYGVGPYVVFRSVSYSAW